MAFTTTETITLEEAGAPELWVTYKRIGMLPLVESQQFFSTHKYWNAKRPNQDGYQTLKEVIEDTNAELAFTMNLIVEWNMPDQVTGEILPVPSLDPSVVTAKVPGIYAAVITKKIKEDKVGEGFLAEVMAETLQKETPDSQT